MPVNSQQPILDSRCSAFLEFDALLADLQNTIPGGRISGGSSPYSSLDKGRVQSPGGAIESPLSKSGSYETKSGSLGRSGSGGSQSPSTTHPGYGSTASQGPGSAKKAVHSNLAELDNLLHELSITEKPNNGALNGSTYSAYSGSPGARSPRSPSSLHSRPTSAQSFSNRPSVDDLLDSLDHDQVGDVIYAGPQKVTITVKETKTETGFPGETELVSSHVTTTKTPAASSATRELDDLMASLSSSKVKQLTSTHIAPSQATTASYVSHTKQNLDYMLGNLQEDMSRQGVNTSQKGCCNACDKPIVGQVITALGKTWHPEHFTCAHCSQELGTRNFFERDGKPYCEVDYHNLFSPRCAYCNGPILDKCVTALEKTWHMEHFFCAQCGKQFGEEGFHERDGKPYCREDYFDMFAPKCGACNRPIMDNYISALNSQWHPDCFVCRDCKKAVQGTTFYAVEGKPVCPKCIGADEEDE